MTTTETRTTNNARREPSIIAQLRQLMPKRPLSFSEAKRLAELQASTLLASWGISLGWVSEALIADLPRVNVQYRSGLPGSGITTWERGAWRIAINRDEPAVRGRFTLAHELKHVLDASHEDAIYRHLPNGPGRARHIEAVCDHFAASLLMPRSWVKRLWGEGVQDLGLLAQHFDVSQQAMLIRLQYLGLVDPLPRCLSAVGRVAVTGSVRTSRQRTAQEPSRRPTSVTYWRHSSTMPVLRLVPAA